MNHRIIFIDKSPQVQFATPHQVHYQMSSPPPNNVRVIQVRGQPHHIISPNIQNGHVVYTGTQPYHARTAVGSLSGVLPTIYDCMQPVYQLPYSMRR
jgi:hypothetical protein